MQKKTLEFPHNARLTYTAIKRLFEKRTKFSSVKCNDDLFIVEARHGMCISPFTENVKMKVSATSSQTCMVVIESSSRSSHPDEQSMILKRWQYIWNFQKDFLFLPSETMEKRLHENITLTCRQL